MRTTMKPHGVCIVPPCVKTQAPNNFCCPDHVYKLAHEITVTWDAQGRVINKEFKKGP